jgi:hypothetical protein
MTVQSLLTNSSGIVRASSTQIEIQSTIGVLWINEVVALKLSSSIINWSLICQEFVCKNEVGTFIITIVVVDIQLVHVQVYIFIFFFYGPLRQSL